MSDNSLLAEIRAMPSSRQKPASLLDEIRAMPAVPKLEHPADAMIEQRKLDFADQQGMRPISQRPVADTAGADAPDQVARRWPTGDFALTKEMPVKHGSPTKALRSGPWLMLEKRMGNAARSLRRGGGEDKIRQYYHIPTGKWFTLKSADASEYDTEVRGYMDLATKQPTTEMAKRGQAEYDARMKEEEELVGHDEAWYGMEAKHARTKGDFTRWKRLTMLKIEKEKTRRIGEQTQQAAAEYKQAMAGWGQGVSDEDALAHVTEQGLPEGEVTFEEQLLDTFKNAEELIPLVSTIKDAAGAQDLRVLYDPETEAKRRLEDRKLGQAVSGSIYGTGKVYKEATPKQIQEEILAEMPARVDRVLNRMEKQLREGKLGSTWQAMAVSGLGQMVPYMLTFAATGGVATAGRAFARQAAMKLLDAAHVSLRSLGARMFVKGAGWIGAGVARTAFAPNLSAKEYVQNELMNYSPYVSPDGKSIEIARDENTTPLQAVIRATAGAFIASLAETSGEALVGGLAARKAIRKGFGPMLANPGMAKFLKSIVVSPKMRAGLKKVAYNGVIPEWLEERFEGVLRYSARLDKNYDANWATAKGFKSELGVLVVPGAAARVASIPGNIKKTKSLKARAELKALIESESKLIREAAESGVPDSGLESVISAPAQPFYMEGIESGVQASTQDAPDGQVYASVQAPDATVSTPPDALSPEPPSEATPGPNVAPTPLEAADTPVVEAPAPVVAEKPPVPSPKPAEAPAESPYKSDSTASTSDVARLDPTDVTRLPERLQKPLEQGGFTGGGVAPEYGTRQLAGIVLEGEAEPPFVRNLTDEQLESLAGHAKDRATTTARKGTSSEIAALVLDQLHNLRIIGEEQKRRAEAEAESDQSIESILADTSKANEAEMAKDAEKKAKAQAAAVGGATRADVAAVLASQPSNKGKSPETLSDRWVASEQFAPMRIPLASVGIASAPKGTSQTTGPIIVDENIAEVGRVEGQFGAPPRVLVLDGKHRVAEALARGEKWIDALVGDKARDFLDSEANKATATEAEAVDAEKAYLAAPNGTTLRRLRAAVGQEAADVIRAKAKADKEAVPPKTAIDASKARPPAPKADEAVPVTKTTQPPAPPVTVEAPKGDDAKAEGETEYTFGSARTAKAWAKKHSDSIVPGSVSVRQEAGTALGAPAAIRFTLKPGATIPAPGGWYLNDSDKAEWREQDQDNSGLRGPYTKQDAASLSGVEANTLRKPKVAKPVIKARREAVEAKKQSMSEKMQAADINALNRQKEMLAKRKADEAAARKAKKAAAPAKAPKATPAARKLAEKNNVDLAKVPGTGQHGTVKKSDVQAYLPSQVSDATIPAMDKEAQKWKESKQAAEDRKQMLEDVIATNRDMGRPVVQSHLDMLAEVNDFLADRIPEEGIASNLVFGHPQATSVYPDVYGSLVPTRVTPGRDITRKIDQVQSLLDKLQSKHGKAESVASGKMKGNKKKANEYLRSYQAPEDEAVREMLRDETLPELNRLAKLLAATAAKAQPQPAPEGQKQADPSQMTRAELEAEWTPAVGKSQGRHKGDIPPLGTWRVDPQDGSIEQLREFKIADLLPGEDVDAPEIRADLEQYEAWYRDGTEPPPATVVRVDGGGFRSINRRRVEAARRAGRKTIVAWFSETAPGKSYTPLKHSDLVQQALKDGKPVPLSVLEDYRGEKWADAALAAMEGEKAPAKAPAPVEEAAVSDAVTAIKAVHAQAASLTTDSSMFKAVENALNTRRFNKAQVIAIADSLGLGTDHATKKAAAAAILRMMESRRVTPMRAEKLTKADPKERARIQSLVAKALTGEAAVEEAAVPAPAQDKGGEAERPRTTPKLGTPERKAADEAFDVAEAETDAAFRAFSDAKNEAERTRVGTKKRDRLETKAQKLKQADLDARERQENLRGGWIDAQMEDAAEQSDNPILQIAAKHKLKLASLSSEERGSQGNALYDAAFDSLHDELNKMAPDAKAKESDGAGHLSAERDTQAVATATADLAREVLQNPLLAQKELSDRLRGRIRGSRLSSLRMQTNAALEADGIEGSRTKINGSYQFDQIKDIATKARAARDTDKSAREAKEKADSERNQSEYDAYRKAFVEALSKSKLGLAEKSILGRVRAAVPLGEWENGGKAWRDLISEGVIEVVDAKSGKRARLTDKGRELRDSGKRDTPATPQGGEAEAKGGRLIAKATVDKYKQDLQRGLSPEEAGLNPYLRLDLIYKASILFIDMIDQNIRTLAGAIAQMSKDFGIKGVDMPAFSEMAKEAWEYEDVQKALKEANAKAEPRRVKQEPVAPKKATPERTAERAALEDDVTSMKNAVTEAIVEGSGRIPFEGTEAQSVEEWEADAAKALAEDPKAGERIITRILDGEKPDIGPGSGAILAQHVRTVVNSRNSAQRKLDEATGEQAQFDATAILIETEIEAARIQKAGKIEGEAWGRWGVMRQAMKLADYSNLRKVGQMVIAKGGEPLTKSERAEFERLTDEIAARTKAEDAANARADKAEQAAAIDRMALEAKSDQVAEKKAGKKSKRKSKAYGRTNKFIKQDEYNKLLSSVTLFGNPAEAFARGIAGLARIGAYHLEAGSRSLIEWSRAMLEAMPQHSDVIKPRLKQLWAESKKVLAAGLREQNVAGMKAASAEGKPLHEIVFPVRQLTKDFIVEMGLEGKFPLSSRERNALVAAVHGVLSDIDPDFTTEDTWNAISGYGKFKPASKEGLEITLQDLRAQLLQLGKLKDVTRGVVPKSTGRGRQEESEEARRLRNKVHDNMVRDGLVATDPDTQNKTVKQTRMTYMRNRMAMLAKAMKDGVRARTPARIDYTDPELQAMQAEYDAIKADYAKMFPKEPISDEQWNRLAIASTKRSEAAIQKRIDALDLFPGKKRLLRKADPELEAARAQRDAVRAELKSLQDAADLADPSRRQAILEAAYTARLLAKLASAQEQLATGQYVEKKKRVERVLTQDQIKLRHKVRVAQQKIDEIIRKETMKRESNLKKTARLAHSLSMLPRELLASSDLSFIGRQGLFGILSHPKLGWDSFAKSLGAIKSDDDLNKLVDSINSRYWAPMYDMGGLAFATTEGTLGQRAEEFGYGIGQKIPVLGKYLIAPSERAYIATGNVLRANLFDAWADAIARDGKITTKQAKLIAAAANMFTGRGVVSGPKMASILNGLGALLFSPRLLLSRFEMALGVPIWMPLARGEFKLAAIMALEYAKIAAALAAIYLAVGLLPDDWDVTVIWDSNSTDFGKIRFGDTRIDPLGGMSQTLVFASRLGTGRKTTGTGRDVPLKGPNVPYGGDDVGDIITRFIRTKLAPGPGVAYSIFKGENVIGEKMDAKQIFLGTLAPLALQDTWDAIAEHGIPKGVALGIAAMLGVGVQTYKQKRGKRTPKKKKKYVSPLKGSSY